MNSQVPLISLHGSEGDDHKRGTRQPLFFGLSKRIGADGGNDWATRLAAAAPDECSLMRTVRRRSCVLAQPLVLAG
jgi:hypothetical protein